MIAGKLINNYLNGKFDNYLNGKFDKYLNGKFDKYLNENKLWENFVKGTNLLDAKINYAIEYNLSKKEKLIINSLKI